MAAYIINGHCKQVMGMSQADQFELWQSVVKGSMDAYRRISSRLKMGPVGEDCVVKTVSSAPSRQSSRETDMAGSARVGRIPVRLYVRYVNEDIGDLEDTPPLDNWDSISYINRPVEVYKEHESHLTLKSALSMLLPEVFTRGIPPKNQEEHSSVVDVDTAGVLQDIGDPTSSEVQPELHLLEKVKRIRIQGIELDLDIPFYWVVNNLIHPEFFLHICIFVASA